MEEIIDAVAPADTPAADRDQGGITANDPVFRTLELYRRTRELTAALSQAWPESGIADARIVQVYYNPFSRARLVAELEVEDSPSIRHLLSIKIFSTPERAAQVYERALAKHIFHAAGPAVVRLRDGCTLAWWLPHGQNLRKIRVCFDVPSFRKFLHQNGIAEDREPTALPRLIRYVPRRRAVFHWQSETEALYFKFYGRDIGNAVFNLRLLNGAGAALGFLAPEFLCYDAHCNAVAMREVPGIPLTRLLPIATNEDIERVGAALATLHAAPIKPAEQWTAQREMRELTVAIREIELALPDTAADLDALRARLIGTRSAGSFAASIHANLFGDQILIAADTIGIVDWDDLAAGDPLYDLGRLAAHFIYLYLCDSGSPDRTLECLHALLRGYADTGAPIDYDRLRWHMAMALVLRAKISALRALPPGWNKQIRESIAAAQLILEGRWLP